MLLMKLLKIVVDKIESISEIKTIHYFFRKYKLMMNIYETHVI